MKLTNFLKDFLTTGFTQLVVVLMGMLTLRIMATGLDKELFGVLIVIRRYVGIAGPILSLNLSIGIARYVAFDKEKASHYAAVSVLTLIASSAMLLILLFLFGDTISFLVFGKDTYVKYTYLLELVIVGDVILGFAYAYARGSFNINKANLMLVLFNIIPLAFLALGIKWYDNIESLFSDYLLLLFVLGSLIGFCYLWKKFSIVNLWLQSNVFSELKRFFLYSVNRIPSSVLLGLVFSFPVFWASHLMSLNVAGEIGVCLIVVRLLELVATPVNIIILPRFAEAKRNNDSGKIKTEVGLILAFIFLILPLLSVIVCGFAKYIILICFDAKYLNLEGNLQIVILVSGFYVAYSLLRGVLDGLYDFPFVNVICVIGCVVEALFLVILGDSLDSMVISFAMGLVSIGLSAIFITVKKVGLELKVLHYFGALIISVMSGVLLFYSDSMMRVHIKNDFYMIFPMIAVRLLLLLIVYAGFLKKTVFDDAGGLLSQIVKK